MCEVCLERVRLQIAYLSSITIANLDLYYFNRWVPSHHFGHINLAANLSKLILPWNIETAFIHQIGSLLNWHLGRDLGSWNGLLFFLFLSSIFLSSRILLEFWILLQLTSQNSRFIFYFKKMLILPIDIKKTC